MNEVQRDNTGRTTLALHVADAGWIPGTTFTSPSIVISDP